MIMTSHISRNENFKVLNLQAKEEKYLTNYYLKPEYFDTLFTFNSLPAI